MVECQLPKLDVAGSIPVSRSMKLLSRADFQSDCSPNDSMLQCFSTAKELKNSGVTLAAGPRCTSSK